MNRRVAVAVVALVILGAIGYVVVRRLKGLRDTDTNIAVRQAYRGPATMPVAVEDWPKWRGPRGDGISREKIAGTWPKDGPGLLWSADVGLGYSSPIAHQGKVYLFSMNDEHETLTCFDAHSGQILWSEEDPEKGWTKSYPGTRATPAIHGDFIYTYGGAGNLSRRRLEAADPKKGRLDWQAFAMRLTSAVPIDWGQGSSPLVTDKHVYVQGGIGGPVAIAFHHDGQVAWQSEARGVGGYAAPVLIDADGVGQLVVFGGEAIYGMDPLTGRTVWHVPWDTRFAVNAATPVYRDGHLFLTSEYGKGGIMIKVTGSGASTAWTAPEVQGKFQPPILDGDALFVNSGGTVLCMKWPTPELYWTASDPKLRLGVGGSIVRVGDKLILLHERGILSLAKADENGIQLVSQFTPTRGSQVWATPLVYGGRLYVKGETELLCFDVSEPPQ